MEPFAEEEPACGLSRRLRGKRIRYIQAPGFFQRIRHSKGRAARCHFIQVHLREQRGPSFLTELRKGTTVTRNYAFVSPRGILHTLEGSQRVILDTHAHTQDLTGVIHRRKPRPHTSR